MRSEDILSKINKLNKNDPLTKEIIKTVGAEMDKQDTIAECIKLDMIFATASEEMVKFYEEKMKITVLPGQELDGRRSAIEARWKSTGKVDIDFLQSVADSWQNGKITVDFEGNRIKITFNDTLGVPKDTDGLKAALEEVKPAHLPIEFVAIFLYVKDINEMTVSELGTHQIGHFAF